MHVAIVTAVLRQACLLGQAAPVTYALVLWDLFHAFVVWYEEPSLKRRSGKRYEAHCVAVWRWWPKTDLWPGGTIA